MEVYKKLKIEDSQTTHLVNIDEVQLWITVTLDNHMVNRSCNYRCLFRTVHIIISHNIS